MPIFIAQLKSTKKIFGFKCCAFAYKFTKI